MTGKRTRLAHMLKIYIDIHGLSQKQISEHTQIHTSTLSRFLSGISSELPLKDFIKLLTFLAEPALEKFKIT